ncbi:hypothetical protein ACH35V_40830 [Actinomadura sp. 1N219]|uniref:hypothetical protein n=1 Tax=Actinomadura sp. 1N219 TaxID=3375152 RepID=UPI0037A9F604
MTEYFAIITISRPTNNGTGAMQGTFTCTMRVGAGTTRSAIYEHVLKTIPRQFQGGNVMFFSAEPNRAPH